MPTTPSFETLRLPIALALVAIVALVVVTRPGSDETAVQASPTPGVMAVDGGGAVASPDEGTQAGEPTAAPTPEATPEPTPRPTPVPTPVPTPAPAGSFSAQVLACGSIDGPRCEGELDRLPRDVNRFVALVRFERASAGDVIEAVLSGPGGTVSGGPYALQGSGDGYYYTEMHISGLGDGTYTLTAFRNGTAVASRELVRD